MRTVVCLLFAVSFCQLQITLGQSRISVSVPDSLFWVQRDSLIDILVNAHIRENRTSSTMQGYRVQVYSGSGNEARQEANDIRKQLLLNHTDVAVHLVYQPPNFKVRVGDCRTELEATLLKRELSFDYPQGFVVRDDILLPRLLIDVLYQQSEQSDELSE